MSKKSPSSSPFLRFALGIVLILVVSLLAFYLIMRPPMDDIWLMAVFLSITALISGLASYIAYRMGWINRSPTIRVWMTARLMFASQHDLLLATVLLLFAGGIAIALGYFLTADLTDRIRRLEDAAHSIADGDLNTRISEKGQDEISDLAHSFNKMADQLHAAEKKKQEIETLRRDLIAWVSHDLQTPLTSIRAILEAIADGMVDDPDTVQRYLRTAQKDVASLSSLIDDLFQMAQLEAGGLSLDLAYNSISDLVSDTLESFSEPASRRKVGLRGSVAPGIDPVWMDAQRIGRVLNNLVGNALRYTSEGGSVDVNVHESPQGVLVEVSDTGEGIKETDLPLVFDRFYRGEKSRNRGTGGAGLGLAIARGIVQAHNGEITVSSSPGTGTCFSFTIPSRY